MAALKLLAAAGFALLDASAHAHCAGVDGVDRWRADISEASLRTGIPANWIAHVMRAESCGLTRQAGKPTVSRAGAMGLMQLMPGTWDELRIAHGLGSDPHNPRDNILAGAAYLRMMFERFGYPGLFAAYNAGPARYAAHMATGKPLPAETRNYLARVTDNASDIGLPLPESGRPSLFAVWPAVSQNAPHLAPAPISARLPDPLFAVRISQ